MNRRAYLGGHDGHDLVARYLGLCFQQGKDTGNRWWGRLSLGVRLLSHDENSFQDHRECEVNYLLIRCAVAIGRSDDLDAADLPTRYTALSAGDYAR
ncbi:MAG: hypothetical protein JO328_01105 [Hyphomicrobiales bacterium]|nr:hypothetical protein [Hyphomicrobiales bacterium]